MITKNDLEEIEAISQLLHESLNDDLTARLVDLLEGLSTVFKDIQQKLDILTHRVNNLESRNTIYPDNPYPNITPSDKRWDSWKDSIPNSPSITITYDHNTTQAASLLSKYVEDELEKRYNPALTEIKDC